MKYSDIEKAKELALEAASAIPGCDCTPEVVKLDATRSDRVKLEVRYTESWCVQRYEYKAENRLSWGWE